MSIKSRKFTKGIRTKPTTDAATLEGEQRTDSADNKQKIFLDSAERAVVTEDQTQTLTNKSIDADTNTVSNIETDNLKAGVLNTDLNSLTGGVALDTEIPSALAVQTALDGQNDAAEIEYATDGTGIIQEDAPASGKTSTQAAIDELEAHAETETQALADHLVDAVDAHDASAISNAPTGNLLATDVQGALDELQTEIDALPAKTETLQNKTLDSTNTISGSIETPTRSDVKQDTEANLITYAGSASDGQLCFATDTLKMYQVITNALQPVGGGGSTSFEITQTAHGLTVGSGIYHNGTIYVDAQANNASTLAYHTVVEVVDVNTFIAADFGRIEASAHGFTVGQYYFQSEATAGLPVTTEPVSGYSNPLFYVEDANTLQVKCLRPSPIGAAIALDELSDVSTPAPTDGQALIYDNGNSRWEAKDIATSATDISYDNSTSGLSATQAQAAIDEVEARVDTTETNITSNDGDIRELEKVKKINYITNPDAEVDSADWVEYRNTVDGVLPDDFGGTPDLGFDYNRNIANVLRGDASFAMDLTMVIAANAQGHGSYIPFTVDRADLAKKLTISFDYDASDAAYNDGDLRVYVYDVTATNLIRVNGEDVKGGKNSHIAQFQTDAANTDYRLVLHYAGTSLDYLIRVDNIQVGPREVVKGAAMSDWKSYTPTISGFGTVTGTDFEYRRNGPDLYLRGTFTGGTAAGTEAQIGIPSGLAITGHDAFATPIGSYYRRISTTSKGGAILATSGDNYINLGAAGTLSTASLNSVIPAIGSAIMASSEALIIQAGPIPIQGWSSNAVSSEDLGGREIVVEGKGNSGLAITGSTEAIDFTSVEDTTDSWSQVGLHGKDTFTAPETGYYIVKGLVFWDSNATRLIYLYKNNALFEENEPSSDQRCPFNHTVKLDKDDTITIRVNTTATLDNNSTRHRIHIQKLASPQTILETETVAARYTSDSGQSVTNNTGISLILEDIEFDTHGAYNILTGEYTIPVSGFYYVSGHAQLAGSRSGYMIANILIDSVVTSRGVPSEIAANEIAAGVSEILYLTKDSIVEIEVFQNTGTIGLNTDSTRNQFSIARLK